MRFLDGYDVVSCQRCGCAYADGIPPQEVFDQYYRDLSKYDYADRGGAEPPEAARRFHEVADALQSSVPDSSSRIFEIGCGSGQLLKQLRDRGFSNVLGSDPSPSCVRAAEQIYGIPAIACTVFTVPQPPEPYDFLILVGVMEHIRDLDRAVHQLHCLLAAKGRVYIEVPDASRYEARLDAPFQEFSVEHINFFSGSSLANLMRARGFRPVTIGRAVRPQNEVTCPAVYGVFEKSGERLDIVRDLETEPGLRAYIQGCQAEDTRIRAKIEGSLAPGEKMIVWGVGAHTLRLLANGGLDVSRIALFVDSGRQYQGRMLKGIPIVAPSDIAARPEPVLISSRGFQNEIERQIRHDLKLTNPAILLYQN